MNDENVKSEVTETDLEELSGILTAISVVSKRLAKEIKKKKQGTYIEYKHEGLSRYNRDGFQKLKNDYNCDHDIKKLFALVIFGFNHYLRFNKNGEYNVPVGKVDFSKSLQEKTISFIREFQKKEVFFSTFDYKNEALYNHDDAIYYFDPPYLITNAPYNVLWNEEKECELLCFLDVLHSKGKKFVLSNVITSNGKENIILTKWAKKYKMQILNRQYRNANYQKINIADSVEVLITNF